ncbi:MAG: hypothetical protein DRG31_05185, partial [Deltaproteobacteria bacterium]
MEMRGKIIGTVILALLVAGIGCKGKEPPRPKGEEKKVVRVVRVERREIREGVDFVANLEPRRQAQVIPKVSGIIERFYVREGDRVKKGQVLFELEKEDFLLALRQAEATLKEAKASYRQASRDFVRFRELREKNVVSQKEYEEVEVQRDLAHARLEQAQVALEQAKRNLEETVVRAPFSGVVTKRFK